MAVIYGCIGAIATFVVFWFISYAWAWHSNATVGTKYDLNSWIQMGQLVAAQLTAVLTNHSLFNTDIPWLSRIFEKVKGDMLK